MNLWIRSQDRKDLLKIIDVIEISEKNGTYVMITMVQGKIVGLGTYETEERALEVLDEIEERTMLINTISLATDTGSLVAYKKVIGEEKLKGLGYPYQMPKE